MEPVWKPPTKAGWVSPPKMAAITKLIESVATANSALAQFLETVRTRWKCTLMSKCFAVSASGARCFHFIHNAFFFFLILCQVTPMFTAIRIDQTTQADNKIEVRKSMEIHSTCLRFCSQCFFFRAARSRKDGDFFLSHNCLFYRLHIRVT